MRGALDMKRYLINEVVRITGLSRATVLYYEEKGLIQPAQDQDSGYRRYSMKDITTIMFYQSLKNVGISVSEYVDVKNHSDSSQYADVYELVMTKKNIYLKRVMSYLGMWDETLAAAFHLRYGSSIVRMQESKGAWAIKFPGMKNRDKDAALKDWNDYFLEKNVSCFFSMEKVLKGDDSFSSGLSCYEDCALPLSKELKCTMEYIPQTMSVMLLEPFDLDNDRFIDPIRTAIAYAADRGFEMSGDPWGHFGLRDEVNGISTDYLTIWLPVAPKKQNWQ